MSISVVGISYSNQYLSQEALQSLKQATAVIGHVDFLAQIKPHLGLGAEAFDVLDDIRADENFLTARVRHAIDLDAKGHHVAVVSGGDPGVFGMGAAVLEQVNLASGPEAADAVIIVPGLSAYQLAAAAIGSPLNGGFATIALCIDSVAADIIDRQISGIAATDLACAVFMLRHNAENYPELYPEFDDPITFSRTRVSRLISEFSRTRNGATPVVLASRVGAADQTILRLRLDSTEDAFDSMGEESMLIICAENAIQVGDRLLMPAR